MKWTIGIDEVGRGALAGPVVVVAAGIACPPSQVASAPVRRSLGLGTLKDSKKLSAKQRELWYAYFLRHPKISFTIARVYPREIEKRNISQAANLAAARAYARLIKRMKKRFDYGFSGKHQNIFLDGGLYLGNRAWQSANVRGAKTIIKADEKIAAVAIASIIAKVHRDKFMCKLAKQYPAYGFHIHKGYGTKIHREAIGEYGPCIMHRLTFLRLTARI